MVRQQTKLPDYLTQSEFKRLLSKITSKRDNALIYVAYRHGLRVSEARLLDLDDIDFQRQRIRIRRLKGSLSGEQPLDAKTIRLIKKYLATRRDDESILFRSRKGGPLSSVQVHRLFAGYAAQAKLPKEKHHFHVLKHSIATHLIEAEAGIEYVREWLGHRNIQNTLIYAQMTGKHLDATAKRVTASGHVV